MWSIRLGLVLGVLVAAAALLEVGVRLFWRDPNELALARLSDGKEMIVRRSDLPGLEYELTPGAEGWAWEAEVRINSHGMRGPEVEQAKGERYRIAVVGDSIAFGNLLPEEAAFPYQLERLLNEDEDRYEVLNFAVGGYDIVQEVASVEHKVMGFRPDLVVLAYSTNDVGIVSMNAEYLTRLKEHQQSFFFGSHLFRFIDRKLGRARLAEATTQVNRAAVFRERYRDSIDPIGEDETRLRELMASVPNQATIQWYRDDFRIGRIRHALGELARLRERGGFEVVVLVIPWLNWGDDGYPYGMVHEIVAMEAARAGFPVVDPIEELARHPVESLRIKDGDYAHPNELGHGILADALRAYVTGDR